VLASASTPVSALPFILTEGLPSSGMAAGRCTRTTPRLQAISSSRWRMA
jgi:hypothetical protein